MVCISDLYVVTLGVFKQQSLEFQALGQPSRYAVTSGVVVVNVPRWVGLFFLLVAARESRKAYSAGACVPFGPRGLLD